MSRHSQGLTCRTACKRAAVSALLGFLSACTVSPTALSLPELSFTDIPAIRLDVATLEIVNEYQMPFQAPFIEHDTPVAPGAVAERWARDVLKPVGTSGTARFVISEGSITETSLKTRSGIRGILTLEASEEYEATVRATLEIRDTTGGTATASAFARHSRTAREDVSLNQRVRLWYELVIRVMVNFESAFRTQAERHLGAYRL